MCVFELLGRFEQMRISAMSIIHGRVADALLIFKILHLALELGRIDASLLLISHLATEVTVSESQFSLVGA